MRQCSPFALVLFLLGSLAGAAPADLKPQALATVDEHGDGLVELSRQIWRYAETALHEARSSRVLADYARAQGFTVEHGVAGMPTAFIASYGQGKPVIAILGEFDALPGLSQQVKAERVAEQTGAAGHGCGHNLFGPASLGAAIAVKELIALGALRGTIRYYGTPAEESVGGKVYLIRDGFFRDVDVALAWHPADETRADTRSTRAVVDFRVEFHGQTAHAAADPWNGRSAVDALELFTFALNQLREHVRPSVRMHYAIQNGGDVPNVVPAYSRLWCWIRDNQHVAVDELVERARRIVEGAALATGTTGALTIQTGNYEMLVNRAGARLLHDNLAALGAITYSDDEQAFARELQRATGKEQEGMRGELQALDENPGEPEGGSTDVADVSWVVPTLHFAAAIAPADVPWHAWPVVASSGHSIGHKGMLHAAKALAATAVDLFARPELVQSIRAEFEQQTKGIVYRPYIPDGPPPLPAASREGPSP